MVKCQWYIAKINCLVGVFIYCHLGVLLLTLNTRIELLGFQAYPLIL